MGNASLDEIDGSAALDGINGINGINEGDEEDEGDEGDKICCQKGAECYTRQKCHRWVVLEVRPIGGIFSRGRNRPLITANYLLLEGVRLGLSQKKIPSG